MELTAFRQKVEKYTNKIIADLEKVKNESDLGQQLNNANTYKLKHQEKLKELKRNKPEGYIDDGYHTPYKTLGGYEKKVKELESF